MRSNPSITGSCLLRRIGDDVGWVVILILVEVAEKTGKTLLAKRDMGQQGASNTATKRLLRELMEASHIAEDTGSSTDGNSPNPVLVLRPVSDDNLFEWTAVITSSEVDSPYEGGKFKLAINVPSNYPLQPPNMKFISKVCHPNVHFNTGEICLDLLKSSWSPAWTLKSACVAVSLLLDVSRMTLGDQTD
ncbi:hypothetical protein HDU99_000664 [Rhizoclosmatium hyalinum]|nr:hypothetical protein HDU99_000664 [Rhizoclosmatium hyalinum]